jgi:hypothetical protein
MSCGAQRRVVERCDAPRRAALPTVMSISDVDKSYASDRPNQHGWSQGNFKTALLS